MFYNTTYVDNLPLPHTNITFVCIKSYRERKKRTARSSFLLNLEKICYSTEMIVYFCRPLGVSKVKLSPFFFPMSASPSGER